VTENEKEWKRKILETGTNELKEAASATVSKLKS